MENNSDLGSSICRLCLRVYSNDKLVDIFSDEPTEEQAIFAAVCVQPQREDPTTYICVHCRHIISLINTFKEACLQTDNLLKKCCFGLESDSWSILSETDIFQQAADLIERHQQDINAISDNDIDDIENDPLSNSPQPEMVESVFSYQFEHLNEEIIVSEEQIIENEYSNTCTDYPNLNSDSMTSDNHANDDIKIENMNSDTSSYKPDDKTPALKRKRAKSENKRNHRMKIVCSICGISVTQQTIEGHLNRHLGVQPFTCDVDGCKAKLHSKDDLRQHRSRHKSSTRFYDCQECGKRIKGAASWLVHRKLHTEEPRFPCEVCGKKFRRRYKLKVHSAVHTGIAEHECDICGRFFNVKHNLASHYKLHLKKGITDIKT